MSALNALRELGLYSDAPIVEEKNFFDDPEFLPESPKFTQSPVIEETPKKKPKRTVSMSKYLEIGKYLYDKGLRRTLEKEYKRQQVLSRDCSFTPTLNTNSLKIMQYYDRNKPKEVIEETVIDSKPKKKKVSKTFMTRNYFKALETIKKKSVKVENNTMDEECTFKPKLDQNSKKISEKYKSNLFDLAKQRDSKLNDKIRKNQEIKEKEEVKECTFMPQILRNYQVSPQESPQPASKKQLRYSNIHRNN